MPELTNEQLQEIVLEVLKASDDVYNKDVVFVELFSKGVPFTKINQLYREVGLANGLIVDQTQAKEKLMEVLGNCEVTSFENYEAVVSLGESIAKETDTPVEIALKCIRSYFKEQEVMIPRKSREYAPRGPRGSKVAEAIADYCKDTIPADLTRKAMYDVILPHVKAPKNAYDQVNSMFVMVFAIHNSITFEDAKAKLENSELLNLVELEAEVSEEEVAA